MGRVAVYAGFGNPQSLPHHPHIACVRARNRPILWSLYHQRRGLHMRFNRDRMFYASCHFCDYIKQLDQRCFGVLAFVRNSVSINSKKIKLETFIVEVKADLGP